MQPFWQQFSLVPVGTQFEIPGEPPIRVKVNNDTSCWHADWIRGSGPRVGSCVYHHGDRHEMVLVLDRRTGVEDRRVTEVHESAFVFRRANSGRRPGDRERFIERKRAKLVHVNHRTGERTTVDLGVKIDVTPAAKEYLDAVKILGETDKVLDGHFGMFRQKDPTAIPRQVAQVCEDSVERRAEANQSAYDLRSARMHVETLQKRNAEVGAELQAQQRRMAAVRTALDLPIGEPVDAIKGLQSMVATLTTQVDRVGEFVNRADVAPYARAGETITQVGDRLLKRIQFLEGERDSLITKLEDSRRRNFDLKSALLGRPTGLGPMAFAAACALRPSDLEQFQQCPRKFWHNVDPLRATGRTTRMLKAAIDAMAEGKKVLVCGAGGDTRRLREQCVTMMRERMEGVITNETLRELRVKGFPGRIRFATLPPPARVDMTERDLAGGTIFVDHFAIDRLFSVLTDNDGRSRSMLRLAYPLLAAQLDR